MADTWHAIIDAVGNLVSTGTIIADDATLTAAGLSALALAADPTGQVWNPATRAFSTPPVVIPPLSRVQFMFLFTATERVALRKSTDAVVEDFVWLVNNADTVDLSHPTTQQGVAYLVSIGLLTQARANAVLAGTAP